MATSSTTSALRLERDTMTELLDLLNQEQQYLVGADTDALEKATPAKTAMVKRMAAATAQRHETLVAAGYPGNDGAMDQWLATSGDTDAAVLWQSLLDLTREAKELNRVNGMLIARHLAHNQGLLNAMRQPAGEADTTVYGPSGQTSAIGPSRRFVVG